MQNAALRELGLDYVYLPFDVEPARLGAAAAGILALNIAGVNVTIPHKEKIIEFLDEVSDEARLIGSVNTVSNERGRLKGYSTDGEGFFGPLRESGFDAAGKTAVVLGAGGSARAVTFALIAAGMRVVIANRTVERAEALADQVKKATSSDVITAVPLDEQGLRKAMQDAELLVNCTSVGMWPDTGRTPCPKELLHPKLLVYDLVYNPVRTRLLTESEDVGAKTMSGVKMLVYQGAESLRIWLGQDPPLAAMEKALMSALGA